MYLGQLEPASESCARGDRRSGAGAREREEVEQNVRLRLKAGDELSFGMIKGGTKFFVAVEGGIDVPLALGSRSTYPIGRIGGVDGRALRAGDVDAGGSAGGDLAPEHRFGAGRVAAEV